MLLRSIDFGNQTVLVDIRRPISPEQYASLRRFVEMCHDHGFIKVTIGYARSLPKRDVAKLKNLKKSYRSLSVRLSSDQKRLAKVPAHNTGVSRRESLGDDNRTPFEYMIRLSDFQCALDRINSVVLIIGLSISLDEQCLSHLEFCLHELVANTVEHADFTTSNPEIQVTLTTQPDSVHVAYRDNAEPFQPSDRLEVDISDRIKEGKKRGFGIFLLNKITEAFKHERENKWNNTTFRIKRNLQPQEA